MTKYGDGGFPPPRCPSHCEQARALPTQLAFAPKFGLERLFQFQKAVESASSVFNVSWRRWRYGRSPRHGAAPPFLPSGEDGACIRRGEWSAYYVHGTDLTRQLSTWRWSKAVSRRRIRYIMRGHASSGCQFFSTRDGVNFFIER